METVDKSLTAFIREFLHNTRNEKKNSRLIKDKSMHKIPIKSGSVNYSVLPDCLNENRLI